MTGYACAKFGTRTPISQFLANLRIACLILARNSRANDAALLALYQSVHLNRHFVGIIAQSLADVNVIH